MTISVEVRGVNEITNYLRGIPDELYDGSRKEFNRSAFKVKGVVQRRIQLGPLHSRTGFLGKSMRASTKGSTLSELKSSVWSIASYAAIHEYGGTITAKNAYKGVPGGPYLNIPSEFNKTPDGVTRMTAKQVFSDGGFVLGRTVMGFKSYDDDELLPMFYLVKSVEIPARLGMRDAAEDEVPTLLSNLSKATLEAIQ